MSSHPLFRQPLTWLLALLISACGSSSPLPRDTPNFFVLTTDGQLARFAISNPGEVTAVGEVSGLAPGEALIGMDFRPATGALFAVGNQGGVYTLNTDTAEAMQVATLSADGLTPLMPDGTAFGVDFNPVPDRLRIVSDSGQNLRANVDTGETLIDGDLAYAMGDANEGAQPAVVAAAYTNSRSGEVTATELFVIDGGLDVLAKQDPPNDGVLNTRGMLGIEASSPMALDIAARFDNTAYAAVNTPDGPQLLTVNLASGRASLIGALGIEGEVLALSVMTP